MTIQIKLFLYETPIQNNYEKTHFNEHNTKQEKERDYIILVEFNLFSLFLFVLIQS